MIPVVLLAVMSARADVPTFMESVCTVITPWVQVPHDWDPNVPREQRVGNGNNQYLGKDWWYYKDDWRLKIADGDLEEEKINDNNNFYCSNPDHLLSTITTTNNEVMTQAKCRKACSNSYTLQVNQAMYDRTGEQNYCRYFDYDTATETCNLFRGCNWAQPNNVATRTTYRIREVYPAGFKSFQLSEFNEPPVCIKVDTKGPNKKVEVMIESDVKDARICIVDGSDAGVSNNDIGNVKTCDNGQLYSCFTAANRDNSNEFYFYIFCDEACEAADVPIWVRIRVSDNGWDSNKSGVDDDIEMWCEMEKQAWIKPLVGQDILFENGDPSTSKQNPLTGESVLNSYPENIRPATVEEQDSPGDYIFEFNDFTWPSELNPDEPSEYPFRVTKGLGSSAPSRVLCLTTLAVVIAFGLLM